MHPPGVSGELGVCGNASRISFQQFPVSLR
jgi:hypothetical protein